MQTPSPTSLPSLVEAFMRIYGLSAGEDGFPNLRHDSIHVMTGFGVGVADEMRVAVVEMAMVNAPGHVRLEDAFKRAARVRELFVNNYIAPQFNRLNITPAELQSKEFNNADAMTQALHPDEIKELFEAGLEMDKAIEKLTGRPYRFLCPRDYADVDFSDVDFTAQMNNIKLKHMLERNAKVEAATAKILFDAASEKGRGHDIPAPGSPWIGPLRKPFAG